MFSEKIIRGKHEQLTEEFMVIARIESFICGAGLNDAIKRADAYINAGADGIMIHSALRTPEEVFSFAEIYKKNVSNLPLVVVPSTFSHVNVNEFEQRGFNVVIYANQILRSSVPAMINTAKLILENGESASSDNSMISISDLLQLIPASDQ